MCIYIYIDRYMCNLDMSIYMYIYIYVFMCIHNHMYGCVMCMYIERFDISYIYTYIYILCLIRGDIVTTNTT